jgi:hypothetical protein
VTPVAIGAMKVAEVIWQLCCASVVCFELSVFWFNETDGEIQAFTAQIIA